MGSLNSEEEVEQMGDESNESTSYVPHLEGDWSVVVTPSTDYTPHVITAEPGEDLTFKIISVAEQGPRAIWIISANGAVSNVRLRRPDTDEGSITLEGVFEIAHLSGSFMFYDNRGTMSGGLSVSLSGPNGSCIGGAVCGSLIAAGHVQVVVGSFAPGKPDVLPKEVTNQNSGEPQPNLGSSPPGQSENRAPAS
ncbi:AT-hook motif nuclear-localized protein 7 isoform X1 [Prunus persica]|uniref:AT-hook motif nuclear-localized protein 7 isoform X1 n=1 Tax=Prunus persica TaxID=3760 RepID=UPI0009AB4FF3|nr:AT-hook motif nuclear-localized protein 7 isoform X1 [Prunus persica]